MNIVCFSGGKDSTALILWAKENLDSFQTIFCDTNWEHPLTYKYIEYINETLLDKRLIILNSKKYHGFEDMCMQRKRVPSVVARFCTEELKLFPTKEYIQQFDNVHLYMGIRAEESAKRAKMQQDIYDEDFYNCWLHRPLLHYTAKDVFDLHKKNNINPNPLYLKGMTRVGCFPCIMVNYKELRNIIKQFPETIDKIRNMEIGLGKTFFSVDYIPEWAMSKRHPKTGLKVPFIDDVVKYVQDNPDQLEMFEIPSCMSYYGLCE